MSANQKLFYQGYNAIIEAKDSIESLQKNRGYVAEKRKDLARAEERLANAEERVARARRRFLKHEKLQPKMANVFAKHRAKLDANAAKDPMEYFREQWASAREQHERERADFLARKEAS